MPKMASTFVKSEMRMASTTDRVPRNLFRVIATDIHFWIPFTVLIGGFLLLDKLR